MKRQLPWILGVWAVLLSAAWVVSFALYYSSGRVLPIGPPAMIFLVVGGVLTARVRGNLIGPLLVVGASLALIYDVGTAYATASAESGAAWPGEYVAAWLGAWTGPIAFLTLPVLLVLFPDGRFTGRRRWFIPLFALVIGLALFGAVRLWGIPAVDLVSVEEGGRLRSYQEYGIFQLAYPVAGLLSVPAGVSLLLRFRKSGTEQRQQIKWLASAVVLAPILSFLVIRVFPDRADLVLVVAVSAFPLAVGVAVLRYRLYDLDRLISRTVAYTMVVALLGALFALAVVVVPNWASGDEAPPWLVAAATLAAAAAFNPLRKWILRLVDKQFNRSRYDAERVMDTFAASLRDRVDADSVMRGWVGVVNETMQPTSLGVWVKT